MSPARRLTIKTSVNHIDDLDNATPYKPPFRCFSSNRVAKYRLADDIGHECPEKNVFEVFRR